MAKGNWAAALQGLGAGLQGQGPQWMLAQQRQREYEEALRQQKQQQSQARQSATTQKAAAGIRMARQALQQDPARASQIIDTLVAGVPGGSQILGQVQQDIKMSQMQTGLAPGQNPEQYRQRALKQLSAIEDRFVMGGALPPDGAAAQDSPASVREWEYYQSLSPEDKEEFKRLQSSGYLQYDPESRGISRGEDVADVEALSDPEAQAAAARQQAVGDVETGQALSRQRQLYGQEREQELAEERPATERRLDAQNAQLEMLAGLIDQAKEMANGWTTGVGGAVFQRVPGSQANDLRAQLGTIRANAGFDKLQQIRDNSPTGGSLGNVSDNEGRRLENVWGNLEQSQSKEQFIKNLDSFLAQYNRSWEAVARAYEETYNVPYTPDSPPRPSGGPGLPQDNQQTTQSNLDRLMEKHGAPR